MITRDVIRDQLFDVLDPITATKHDTPYYPLEQDQLPAIKIYTPRDEITEIKDADPLFHFRRKLTVIVECVVMANENAVLDADNLSNGVLILLMANNSLNNTIEQIDLNETTTEVEAGGDVPVVKAAMMFDAFYWQMFDIVEAVNLLKHVTTLDECERTELIKHPDDSITYEEFPL